MRFVLAATCAAIVLGGFAARAGAVVAPVANPDSASTTANTPVDIDVLANDTLPAGFFLVGPGVIILDAPEHGTATEQAGHVIRYTPSNGFVGDDSFVYELCMTQGKAASVQGDFQCPITTKAPVTVTVTAPPSTTTTEPATTTSVEPLAVTTTTVASTTSTVAAAASNELPHTGSGSTPLGIAGIVAVAAGGAAILASRRGRQRS